jgi:hypothetical protein
VAAPPHQLVRGAEELHGVRVLPLRVGVGKQLADVPRSRRAEDGVGERMGDGISVRVPRETARVGDAHPREQKRARIGEAVRIVADADSHYRERGSTGWR